MLRDFVHTLDSALVTQTLKRFDISIPDKKHAFTLIEFQVITPDSIIWRFLINRTVYYLYAEDYVEGLKDVQNKISSYAVKDAKLDFIKVKQPKTFDDAEPRKTAVIYEEPENSNEMMQFAVDSGHDFVFLCSSTEDANNALFND